MSAPVLLNLINELGKIDKMQEQKCSILFIMWP